MRKVLLSSTTRDLKEYRDAVFEALTKSSRVDVTWMNDWAAQPLTPVEVCREAVEQADIYVGLIGHCFGSSPPDTPSRSYTMHEFDTATAIDEDPTQRKYPRLVHVAPDTGFNVEIGLLRAETPEQQAAQIAFRNELLENRHAGQQSAWSNPYRLASQVVIAVEEQIARLDAEEQTGFTRDSYAVSKFDRRNEILKLLEQEDAERDILLNEKAELERKLNRLDDSYNDALGVIEDLKSDLEEYATFLSPKVRDQAKVTLIEGDFDGADHLLARMTERFEEERRASDSRAAIAYYRRGQIAEEQVRWKDAASHFSRAAKLEPSYRRLLKEREFHWRAGDLAGAESAGERLLSFTRSNFGGDSEEFAIALNEHAHTLRHQGEYSRAEAAYREAIDFYEKKADTKREGYATTLNNLAVLLRKTNRHDDAERFFRKVMEIDRETIGEEHPEYAKQLNNLALTLQDLGRTFEAEKLMAEVLEIDLTNFGDNHPTYANHLGNFAGIVEELGRPADAEELFREALAIDEETIGEHHPNHAIRLKRLAGLLNRNGRTEEALQKFKCALTVFLDSFGPEHKETIECKKSIALISNLQNNVMA